MANRNKAKGSSFERLVADFLRDNHSEFIDRRPLAGAKDLGDIANVRVGKQRLVIEAKNHARMDLAGWVQEAQDEAVNDNALAGVVVAKRKGKGQAEDQYVICTLGDFVRILHAASER